MADAGIFVRSGRMEDLEAILSLERRSQGAPHWGEAVYRDILEPTGRDTKGVLRRLLLAEAEGVLTGFAVARVRCDAVADGVELESVLVAEEQRRRGVGRMLCAAIVTWAQELGAVTVELEVRASSGARELYGCLGFTEVGRRRGYYCAPEEDAVLMRLELW